MIFYHVCSGFQLVFDSFRGFFAPGPGGPENPFANLFFRVCQGEAFMTASARA